MKKFVKILLFFLLFINTKLLISQIEFSVADLRMISFKTIQLVEGYEKFSRFSNRDDVNNFIALFVQNNAEHVNDVIPDNKMDQILTPSQYVSSLKKYFNQVLVRVDIDSITLPETQNNQHSIQVFIKKYVECTTKNCNITFKDTMNLVFNISFEYKNEVFSNFLIQKISFLNPRGRFIYFRTHNDKSEMPNFNILINGQLYKTDNRGLVKIEVLDVEKSYTIKSLDEVFPQSYYYKNFMSLEKEAKLNDSCASIFTLDLLFKPLYWQTDMFVSNHIFSNDYTISGSSNLTAINVDNRKATDLGVKIGYRIFNNNQFTGYVIKTGASYKSFSFSSFAENIKYSYNELDSDKDPYLRMI